METEFDLLERLSSPQILDKRFFLETIELAVEILDLSTSPLQKALGLPPQKLKEWRKGVDVPIREDHLRCAAVLKKALENPTLLREMQNPNGKPEDILFPIRDFKTVEEPQKLVPFTPEVAVLANEYLRLSGEREIADPHFHLAPTDAQLRSLTLKIQGIRNRQAALESLRDLQNYLDDGVFIKTLKKAQDETGSSDSDVAKAVGRNKTTIGNWRARRVSPTWNERLSVLQFFAEKLSERLGTSVLFANYLEAVADQDAILKSGQNSEGNVDPAESAAGDSGE